MSEFESFQFVVQSEENNNIPIMDNEKILIQNLSNQKLAYVPYKINADGDYVLNLEELIPVSDNNTDQQVEIIDNTPVLSIPETDEVATPASGQAAIIHTDPENEQFLNTVQLQTDTHVVSASSFNETLLNTVPQHRNLASTKNKSKKQTSPKAIKRVRQSKMKAALAKRLTMECQSKLQSTNNEELSSRPCTSSADTSMMTKLPQIVNLTQIDQDEDSSSYWERFQREMDQERAKFEKQLPGECSGSASPLSTSSTNQTNISGAGNDNTFSSDDNSGYEMNRDDTLELISLYKEMRDEFESKGSKKQEVWKKLARKLPPNTWIKCSNRWKYLRSRYLEKLANMSASATGQKKINFAYFDEMDAVLQESHSINPPYRLSIQDGEFQDKSVPGREAYSSDSVSLADWECESAGESVDDPAWTTAGVTLPETTRAITASSSTLVAAADASTRSPARMTNRQLRNKDKEERTTLLRESVEAMKMIAAAVARAADKL